MISCNPNGKFESVKYSVIKAPPIIRADYAALAAEAERKRAKYISLDKSVTAKAKAKKN